MNTPHVCEDAIHALTPCKSYRSPYFPSNKQLHKAIKLDKSLQQSLANATVFVCCNRLISKPPFFLALHTISHETRCMAFFSKLSPHRNSRHNFFMVLMEVDGSLVVCMAQAGMVEATVYISKARGDLNRILILPPYQFGSYFQNQTIIGGFGNPFM